MKLIRAARALLVGVALAGAPAPLWAHAIITNAEPAPDASVPPGHLPIRLQFNSRIDVPRSRVVLEMSDGATRPLPVRAGATPDAMIAEADGLTPGRYRLHWQVLSVDGHITRGDVPFTVAPGAR